MTYNVFGGTLSLTQSISLSVSQGAVSEALSKQSFLAWWRSCCTPVCDGVPGTRTSTVVVHLYVTVCQVREHPQLLYTCMWRCARYENIHSCTPVCDGVPGTRTSTVVVHLYVTVCQVREHPRLLYTCMWWCARYESIHGCCTPVCDGVPGTRASTVSYTHLTLPTILRV